MTGHVGQCESGLHAGQESPLHVRGCPVTGALIVGGIPSGDSANLYRINPADGSVLWNVNVGTTASIRAIRTTTEGKVYVYSDEANDKIYEIDPDDGSVLTTSITVNRGSIGVPFDVDSNGKVYARRASDNKVVRLAADLNTVEIAVDTTFIEGVAVDVDGNVYGASSGAGTTIARKFNSSGTTVATHAESDSSANIFAPSGDYIYVTVNGSTTGAVVRKVSKSGLSTSASFTLRAEPVTNQQDPQEWATDGTNLYLPGTFNADALGSFFIKVKISDMSEVARFNTSTDAVPRSLNGCTKVGGTYIAVGQNTATWDGNDGSTKNVFAFNSSLSLQWSARLGTNITLLCASGSAISR